MKQRKLFFIIVISVVLLDQITKLLVISNIDLYQSIEVISSFFYLTYVQNTGGAFSILSGNIILFIIVGILALIVIYYTWEKEKNKGYINLFGYSMVIGGTIGNLIDRILHNYVIDFLEFHFGEYIFPVFNIGDIAIVVGVMLIILGMIVSDKSEKDNS